MREINEVFTIYKAEKYSVRFLPPMISCEEKSICLIMYSAVSIRYLALRAKIISNARKMGKGFEISFLGF